MRPAPSPFLAFGLLTDVGRQRAGVRTGTDIGGDYGPCRRRPRAADVRHEIGRQRLSDKREQLWILKYRGAGAQRTTPR